MSFTCIVESNFVINTAEEGDTLDEIFDFISNNRESWGSRHVMWDMTLFDSQSINPQSVLSFIQQSASLTERRSGLKNAILVPSDLGFGMARMLKILGDGQFKAELGVFRDRDCAIKWLNDEQAV